MYRSSDKWHIGIATDDVLYNTNNHTVTHSHPLTPPNANNLIPYPPISHPTHLHPSPIQIYLLSLQVKKKKEMEEKKEMKAADISCLYDSIKVILSNARQQAYRAVNFAMVKSYWLVGQRIVEHEHFLPISQKTSSKIWHFYKKCISLQQIIPLR